MEHYMEVILETLAQRIEELRDRIELLEWDNENLRREKAESVQKAETES